MSESARVSDYPPAAHAAYVWWTGSGLALAVPGGGTVIVPMERLAVARDRADQRGWQFLLDTLSARSRAYAERKPAPSIATAGCPTQEQADRALVAASGARVRRFDARGRERVSCDDLWSAEEAEAAG